MSPLRMIQVLLLYGLLFLSWLPTVRAGIADKKCASDADCPDDVTNGLFGATIKYTCGKVAKQFYKEMRTSEITKTGRNKTTTAIVPDPARNYTVCECLTIEGDGGKVRNATIMHFDGQEKRIDSTDKDCGIGDHQECFKKEFTKKLSRGCASLECAENKRPPICEESSGTLVPNSGSPDYRHLQVSWLLVLGPILILKFWFEALIF